MCEALRGRRPIVWSAWLAIALASAIGLRHYRVDNTLDDWTPQLRPLGDVRSYVVIGWDDPATQSAALATELRALDSVGLCIDRAALSAGQLLGGPSADDLVVGRDGDYWGIFCFAADDTDDASLVSDIRRLLTAGPFATTDFRVAGPATYHLLINDYAQRRMPIIMCAIAACGFLFVGWVVSDFRIALAGTAAILLSLLIFLGGVSWLHIPMDMSVSIVPPLMMALGYSYVVHHALNPSRLRVLVFCVLTTAAGFGTFVFTTLAPIQRFAMLGAIGLVLVWLAAVTLVPAAQPRARPWLRRLRTRCVLLQRHRIAIVLCGVLLTIAAIALAPALRFQTDALSYFPAGAVRDFRVLNQRLTGMLPFQVLIDQPVDATALLEQSAGVRKVIRMPANESKSGATVYWCLADNGALPQLVESLPRWRDWARRHGATLSWRGVAAQLAETKRTITTTALWSLPLMVLLDAAVIYAITRRVSDAAAGAWVCLLPVAVLVLIAWLTRLAIDLPVLMVGAIAVGLAVDDTLHLVSRTRELRSAPWALMQCWRPCVGSSLAGAATLCFFALSPFGPTRQFGLMLCAATLAAMLANQLLLPALLGAQPQSRLHMSCARRRCQMRPSVSA